MASKRKRTEAGGSAEMKVPETTITFTSRKPEWAYFHLELVTQPSESSLEFLDLLTAKTYLTSALSQFLGLSGTVIPIDILKLQTEELPTSPTVVSKRKTRNMLWIRVPHEDAAAVTAAVSSWVGGGGANVAWKIRGKGSWLGALAGGTGTELFVQ